MKKRCKMSTSIKIRKNINMSSKNIVFKGAETGKFAKSHVGKRPKVNMGKAIKLALNSIPATNVVTGDIFQIAKMNMVKRILGSISVVAGSQELFKPENLGENTERNFGEKVYHETSGVHEGTKQEMVTCAVAIKEVKGAVSGWEEINGKWKYHDVTKYAKGWNKIDGKWYYFGSDEYMVTGWHSIGGNIYYFKAKKDVEGESGYGYMWEGWRKIDGKWYYFKKEKDVEGESGYGYVWKDWRKIGNKWYYFKSDGEMVASQMIESSNGKRYYLGADGAMVTSQNVNWDKKDYWANEKGECGEVKGINISKEQLLNLGWSEIFVTDTMVEKLNQMLKKYKIENLESIRHFIAQCKVETGGGRVLIEKYNGNSPEEYFANRDLRKYNDLPDSPAVKGDGAKYRGAGYIQLTWKTTYYDFAKYVGDEKILKEGAEYVAENYAWEAATWFWTKYKKIDKEIINNKIGVDKVSKLVNGGDELIDERRKAYRECCEEIK